MTIAIKQIHHELEIKNNGIEFSVKDSRGKHLGDFYVRKKGVVWCRGKSGVKSSIKSGQSITWNKLIALAGNNWRT